MPYKVFQDGDQYCVHKMNDDGSKGAAVSGGCHPDKKKASAHMRALYSNVPDATKKEIGEEGDELKTKEYCYVPMNILTFSDYDAYDLAEDAAEEMAEQTSIFMQLVQNNIYSPDVKNKGKAIMGLVTEYAKRLESPPDDTKEVTEESQQPEPTPSDSPEPFLLVKEANGIYRWFAIYSNNMRDDDKPAEIISTKSHKTFTDMAMKGEVPMPELWQWHLPGSRWGVADSLYFGDDGFALATGTVDKEKEYVAEAMAKVSKEQSILVSHGMPKVFILRNPDDPTVIDFHITKEISTLPGDRAANKLTGFSLLTKENEMLDEKRKNWLKTFNYTEDEISMIESNLANKAKEGEEREKKEVTEQPVVPVVVAETPVATALVEEKKPEEGNETKELVDAVIGVIKPLAEKITAMEAQIKSLKDEQQIYGQALAVKTKKDIQETPALSLKELMAQSIFGTQALVKEGEALGSDKPRETEVKKPAITGLFLDDIIRASNGL